MIEILVILIFFAYAGFFDFITKEVTKQDFIDQHGKEYFLKNYSLLMPPVMSHSRGWFVWITLIWMLPIFVLSAIYDWRFMSALLLFYTEDVFYYIYTYFTYGTFIPKEVPWLHAGMSWYKKIVGEKFPRKNFYIVYSIQIILFIIFWILFI